MFLLNAIKNAFSKNERDAGTKKGWATIVAAPLAALLVPILGDVMMAPEFHAFLSEKLGPLYTSEFGWVLAIVAQNLGVARVVQPGTNGVPTAGVAQ